MKIINNGVDYNVVNHLEKYKRNVYLGITVKSAAFRPEATGRGQGGSFDFYTSLERKKIVFLRQRTYTFKSLM